MLKSIGSLALLTAVATTLEPCGDQLPTPTPEPTPAETCIVTGCSGQVCAAEEVITTCEWTCEYGCYEYAICEVQPTGVCGWTPTDAFTECVAECQNLGQ